MRKLIAMVGLLALMVTIPGEAQVVTHDQNVIASLQAESVRVADSVALAADPDEEGRSGWLWFAAAVALLFAAYAAWRMFRGNSGGGSGSGDSGSGDSGEVSGGGSGGGSNTGTTRPRPPARPDSSL